MDNEWFDRWTRGVGGRLTRRHLGRLAAGAAVAIGTLGFGAVIDAKKKKRKKRRTKKIPVSYACANINTPCGNTALCTCRVTKANQQICSNGVVPPNGLTFQPCLSAANCGPGEVCDAVQSICVSRCRTN